jgi:hypothetical protein
MMSMPSKRRAMPEPQILNQHFIFSLPDEAFDFLHLVCCVYFEALLRKVFTHRETDRLFIIDNKQGSWTGFRALSFCALSPATKKLSKAARYGFQIQHGGR